MHGIVDLINQTVYGAQPLEYAIDSAPHRMGSLHTFDLSQEHGRKFEVYESDDGFRIDVYAYTDVKINRIDQYRVTVSDDGTYQVVERKRDVAPILADFEAALISEGFIDPDTIAKHQGSYAFERDPTPTSRSTKWRGFLQVKDNGSSGTYAFCIDKIDNARNGGIWEARLDTNSGRGPITRTYHDYIPVIGSVQIQRYFEEYQSIGVSKNSQQIAALEKVAGILGHDIKLIDPVHKWGKTIFQYDDGVQYTIRKKRHKYVIEVEGFSRPLIHQVRRGENTSYLDDLVQSRLDSAEGLEELDLNIFEIDINDGASGDGVGQVRKKTNLNDVLQYAVEIITRKSKGGFTDNARFLIQEMVTDRPKKSSLTYNFRVKDSGKVRDYKVEINNKRFSGWAYEISGPNFTEEGLVKKYKASKFIQYQNDGDHHLVDKSSIKGRHVVHRPMEAIRFRPSEVVFSSPIQDLYFSCDIASVHGRGRITDEPNPVRAQSRWYDSAVDTLRYGGFKSMFDLMGPGGKFESLRLMLETGNFSGWGNNLMANAIGVLALRDYGASMVYTLATLAVLRGLSIGSLMYFNRKVRDEITSHGPIEKWREEINTNLEAEFPLHDRADILSWKFFENALQTQITRQVNDIGSGTTDDLMLNYLRRKNKIHEIVSDANLEEGARRREVYQVLEDVGLKPAYYRSLQETISLLESLDQEDITRSFVNWCHGLQDSTLAREEYTARTPDSEVNFQKLAEAFYASLCGITDNDPQTAEREQFRKASESIDRLLTGALLDKVRPESDGELEVMARNAFNRMRTARLWGIAETVYNALPLSKYLGLAFGFGPYFAWHSVSRVYQGIMGPYNSTANTAVVQSVYRSSRGASGSDWTTRQGVASTTANWGYLAGDLLIGLAVFAERTLTALYKPKVPDQAREVFAKAIQEIGQDPQKYSNLVETMFPNQSWVPLIPYFVMFGTGLGLTTLGHISHFRFQKKAREEFGVKN